MRSTGIVRRVDDLGRIVIPKEMRDTLGIPEGTPLEIFTEGKKIVLRVYEPGCVFCGEVKSLTSFQDRLVCAACRQALGVLA